MALKHGEVNPLGIVGMRKLDFIPEHFAKLAVNRNIDVNLLHIWIEFNLSGRYAIKNKCKLDSNKKIISVYEIGFEDPKELTHLTLGCPHLHKERGLF